MTSNHQAWKEGWRAAMEYLNEQEDLGMGELLQGDYFNPYEESE